MRANCKFANVILSEAAPTFTTEAFTSSIFTISSDLTAFPTLSFALYSFIAFGSSIGPREVILSPYSSSTKTISL